MTTTVTTARSGPLTANGTAPLPFTFQALSAAELEVTRNDTVVSSSTYTVALNGDGTGSVTPTSTWGTDEVWIYSKPNYQQPFSFVRGVPLYPDQMNEPLDRLARTMLSLRSSTALSLPAIGTVTSGSPAAIAPRIVDGQTFWDFTLPAGTNGTNGTNGTTPVFIEGTVDTLPAGSPATFDLTGGPVTYTINVGLPQGQAGAAGGAGTTTTPITFNNSGSGAASGVTFDGAIARTISYNTLGAAPLASPVLTGNPTGPTPAVDDNDTSLATTAYVIGQLNSTAGTIAMNGTQAAGSSLKAARADHVHPTDTSRAPLASPALTGTPTAPTAAFGTNTTQLATTAFVQEAKAPAIQSVASSATVTPTFDNDAVNITAQAVPLTLANWSGTAKDFWSEIIRIKDNGTTRTIGYGANYQAADGLTLPTATTVGKTHELAFVHNSQTGKHVCTSAITY